MPNLTSFGFEAEFNTNANAVIAHLHRHDYSGDSRLHSYHCDCEYCEFDNGYAFRGQTDSSCSGEVISDICRDSRQGREWMDALEAAAIYVDAEPGFNSGFHVHVGMEDAGRDHRAACFYEIVRWEPVLQRIAGGRWAAQRPDMNTTVRNCLNHSYEWLRQRFDEAITTARVLEVEATVTTGVDERCGGLPELRRYLYEQHLSSDRHSNLNIAVRNHPTWEFRLWNSTRVAWRMEMFAGLSVALVDLNVATNLQELTPPRRMANPATGIADITLALSDAGHDRTAELVQRQSQYLTDRADSAPNVLTAL